MKGNQQSSYPVPSGPSPELKELRKNRHAAELTKFPGVVATFMGRDALSLVVSSLNLDASDSVLLPAFTCQEVLKSFVGKVGVAFYDVQADLSIDPDEIRRKLEPGRIRMVLITDYFGFLQPYRHEIRQICNERDICLVEDCAHSLLTEGAGRLGDFAIYSFRKILPLLDGGGLRVNRQRTEFSPTFHPRIYSNALSLTAFAKSRLNIHNEMLSRSRVASHVSQAIGPVKMQSRAVRILPLSYFAERGILRLSLTEVVRKRREDFLLWSEVVRRSPSIVPIFTEIPTETCPLGFPVKVKERPLIEDQARKAGFFLSVHWRLDRGLAPECVSSHKLSEEILTLPVYPHLGYRERETLAKILAGRSY